MCILTRRKSIIVFAVVLLSFFQTNVLCTLYPEKIKPEKVRQLKVLSGPQNENVFQRNLVNEEPTGREILIHNAAYWENTAFRNFNGTALGYITAWNSHGYDVAKMFAKKFDIISPVWLQITKEDGEYKLKGTHDVDSNYMRDLRKKSKTETDTTVKIFPRVIFEHFTHRDYSQLLSVEEERKKVSNLIIRACKEYRFDGIVLEIWSQLAGRVDDQFLYALILDITRILERNNYHLVLVIPPMRSDNMNVFGEKHLDKLYKDVYAFSLMTYDYSNVQRPGANSPIKWVRRSIENLAPENSFDVELKRQKILMGMNMYGNDYTPEGGGPIIGKQFLELLQFLKSRMSYDDTSVENFMEIRTNTGRHYVFYPTLHSINERIKLAKEMGVGISLWELGQGLDYFYDLF